jgi:YHS domain-containing protein
VQGEPKESGVHDPVCGMTVEADGAAAAWRHDGTVYLFCSVACQRRFRADPEHFLSLDDDQRHM